ncbi:permease of the drug/metabolite transporter (DMT) superfamily [Longilinea arvoryzae]|uniref:Permease of the drug/metabolite transporter (DMT) superfamily n=1 Tax=Longilinea arvoryzae TaxID=360412 RepID=A0A0S7BID0_9CHLR|nr:DMT family transporter [Longilinea arvoryzae]GAP14912.1 permease of the drug/metabolite transporter (DMT) superfamily [Longilinea arvoryzae]
MKITQRIKGIQAALASALLLGIVPVFGKQAILFGFTPLAVVALRTSIAVTLLFIITLIHRRQFFYIFPVGLYGCIIAGLINGLGSILYYTALSRISAGIGQLLYSFYPLFVALWLLLDRQTLNRMTIFRLGLSIPGVILLLSTGTHKIDLLGAVLMIGSAVLYALHLIINQRVLYEVPAPTVTFYTLLSMALTVDLAFVLFKPDFPALQTPWWPIIGMGILTFISRLTLFYGVKNLGGLQTALLGLGELLVTVALSWLWLGEQMSPWQWAGTLMLCASLLLVGFDHYPPEKRRSTGWLAWLNPPGITGSEFPGHPLP